MSYFFFFFFNDTATTEIYTLSLHDALPIYPGKGRGSRRRVPCTERVRGILQLRSTEATSEWVFPAQTKSGHIESSDRKSTRLNSSHLVISYAVFCLKKKKRSREPISTRIQS